MPVPRGRLEAHRRLEGFAQLVVIHLRLTRERVINSFEHQVEVGVDPLCFKVGSKVHSERVADAIFRCGQVCRTLGREESR